MAGAPSNAEVEQWLGRIDDVTGAIHDILHADPAESVRQRKAREEQRRAREAAEAAAKAKQRLARYDTAHYTRFDKDEVIEEMLRAVDAPSATAVASRARHTTAVADDDGLSRAERVSLQEAQRLKAQAAKAVQAADWSTALTLYTNALQLHVEDEALNLTLHNNRALVHYKLRLFDDAIDDAGHVLQRDPDNVKARLRRAAALHARHRPVEALADVTVVLQREPGNSEARVQRVALQRAARELQASAAFVGQEDERGAGAESRATRLRDAVRELSAAAPEMTNATRTRLEAALRVCDEVLRDGGLGAVVLFATCGGAAHAVRLALLESEPPTSGLRTACLPLLARVLGECEVATQEVTPAQIGVLVGRLLDACVRCDDNVARQVETRRVALTCLAALAEFFAAVLSRAVVDAGPNVLCTMWHSLSPPCQTSFGVGSTTSGVGYGDVYAYVVFVEALLRLVQRHETCTMGGRDGEDDVVAALRAQLVDEGADNDTPLAVRVAECALKVNAPCVLQTRGAALGLALTTTASSAVTALLRPGFTATVTRVLVTALERPRGRESALLVEGLYALLYNLVLRAPDPDAYVARWVEDGPSSLAAQSLAVLCGRLTDDAVAIASVDARLLAFVSRCASAGRRDTNAFLTTAAQRVSELWGWAARAVAVVVSERAHTTPPPDDAIGDEQSGVGCAWDCLEHLTTLLALIHRERRQIAAASSTPPRMLQRLTTLCEVLVCARPPCDRVVDYAVASPDARLAATTNVSSATAQLVSMGNAALLLSDLLQTVIAAADDDAAGRASVVAQLVHDRVMDTTLHALRATRAALMRVTHELAGRSCSEPSHVRTQLQHWRSHCEAAQQNLAIVISKLCALSDALRDRLRELDGFVTLAAIQQQQRPR